jgi:hypothetical protein
MNLITKQGFKVVGILPFKNSKLDISDFNIMQIKLKKEYSNKKVLFDRDFENNRIIFFIC